jgi:hypothetical protein
MPPRKSQPRRSKSIESEYRNRVSKRRITIKIEGSADNSGAPSLSEFLKQLEAVKVALKHTERLLAEDEGRDVFFRIVGLSMASPATVVLEETPVMVKGKRGLLPKVPVAERLVSTLLEIEQRGVVPLRVRDLAALEAYRNVSTALRYSGEVTISSADQSVSLGTAFNQNIDKIIGPDEILEGSLTGVLLAINLHNTTRFEIYPPAGPSKVACDFAAHLKSRVISGLDHNVRVVGKLRYKHWAPHPHAISADDLEIFPPANQLPTLASLRGLSTREQQATLKQDGD